MCETPVRQWAYPTGKGPRSQRVELCCNTRAATSGSRVSQAWQLKIEVLAALVGDKTSPSNLAIQEEKPVIMTSGKDHMYCYREPQFIASWKGTVSVSSLQCQLGVLPLGTGNDLARVLGWGGLCDDDAQLLQILEKLERATTKMLDRWNQWESGVGLGNNIVVTVASLGSGSQHPCWFCFPLFSMGCQFHVDHEDWTVFS